MRISILSLFLCTRVRAGVPLDLFEAKSVQDLQALGQRRRLDGHNPSVDSFLVEDDRVILAEYFGGTPGFYHSVASGDPTSDSVILWTRYTPVSIDEEVTVQLRMAVLDKDQEPTDALLDPTLNENLFVRTIQTTKAHDFVVKVDVTGLASNSHFAYVFVTDNEVSDVGLTRTAPGPNDDDDDMVYGLFSCSHFSQGYFHAYDVASTITDLDIWFHVGDYYYEYGLYASGSAAAAESRNPLVLPVWETSTLQDYRLRHHTYVGHDEGLRNLRRRAPMMASWDDHETTNNSWGTPDEAGAQNHQETCPVNSTADDATKRSAACDRDEGQASQRFAAAAQAYWEWMPLRTSPGHMGVLDIDGTITQVLEWGNLATVAMYDSRVSYRTKEVGADAFGMYGAMAAYTDVSVFKNESSDAYAQLRMLNQADVEERSSENLTMYGEYVNEMEQVFTASAQAGKTWQILAGNTMMGHYVLPDPTEFYLDVPDELSPTIQQYFDTVVAIPEAGAAARVVSAMKTVNVEFNKDDFGGYYAERARILEMAKELNNFVVLGGDLHDAFAWTLVEGGLIDGEPVGINLGCPGVTSNGFLSSVTPLTDPLGLERQVTVDMINNAYERSNPNLHYANVGNRGFVAVKVTKESNTAEFIVFEPETLVQDFDVARGDALTAPFSCKASMMTPADTPGTLNRSEECVIGFDSTRPAVYDIAVPAGVNSTEEVLADCGYQGCSTSFSANDEVDDETNGEVDPSSEEGTSKSSLVSLGGIVCGLLF